MRHALVLTYAKGRVVGSCRCGRWQFVAGSSREAGATWWRTHLELSEETKRSIKHGAIPEELLRLLAAGAYSESGLTYDDLCAFYPALDERRRAAAGLLADTELLDDAEIEAYQVVPYREIYLKTAHWRWTSAEVKHLADNRCERCGVSGVSLDAHHSEGSYAFVGCELPHHLEVLCRPCHSGEHPVFQPKRPVLS
jgi:hypothetical protein